jgi:hypothetical protein
VNSELVSVLKTPRPLHHSCSMKVTAVSMVKVRLGYIKRVWSRRRCQPKAGDPLVRPGGVNCCLLNLHSINQRTDLFRDGNSIEFTYEVNRIVAGGRDDFSNRVSLTGITISQPVLGYRASGEVFVIMRELWECSNNTFHCCIAKFAYRYTHTQLWREVWVSMYSWETNFSFKICRREA